MTTLRVSCATRALLFIGAAASAFAAAKVDLTRVDPVPGDQQIPIVDFFRQPMLAGPTINRAGTHIAALASSVQDKHVLMVYDIATKKVEVASSSGDRDIISAYWLGDKRVMFGLSSEKLYRMAMCVAEVGNLNRSYPVLQYGGPELVCIPEKKPLEPLVWMRRDFETGRDEGIVAVNTLADTGPVYNLIGAAVQPGTSDLVRDCNNAHTVRSYPVPEGGITTGYLTDKDDNVAFAFTSKDGVQTLQRLDGRTWIKCPIDLDEIDVLQSGEKPGEVLVLGPRIAGKARALQRMDAVTGTLGEVLLQDEEYDFAGRVYRDFETRQILGMRYDRNGPRQVWLDPHFLGVQKALDALFPKQVVVILDWNREKTRFVVGRYTDRQPMVFEWVDLKAGSAGPLKNSRPWIDPARMLPMQMLRFKTKDGKQLDAYLTLPAGTSPEKPAPMVVLPHGGPYVRDTWGFNGEVQFLASRGYAVLQPNYRGSTGRNWVFPHEDEWDFVKMREDVFSATRAALATKLIDRNRVAIMGSSFGGYLAICGAVHQPSLYRCAITINGPFDWGLMAQQQRYNMHQDAQYGWMMRRLGNPSARKEWFDAISPLRQADQIKMPVFVAHGKYDSVVEIGQAHDLINALERSRTPHEKMLVSDEAHGMGHIDNQVELYGRIEAFLAKNLAPVTTPVATK